MPIASFETGHRPRLNHKDHSKTPWPPPIDPRLGGGVNSQIARTAEGVAFQEALVFGNAHVSASETARLQAAAKEDAKAKAEPKSSGLTHSGSMVPTPPHRGAH